MKYKSIVATRRGSTDVLQVTEKDLRSPEAGEVRIKVLASSVTQDDIGHRKGNRPFPPKTPFVPGYAIVGVVNAVGEDVIGFNTGDHVAALTVIGGYAEYIYLSTEQLVQVPLDLEPSAAVTLILNYVVAYQILHSYAKVQPGDKVLIIGASGGVGSAFLQLGKLAGLTMYGLAAKNKHHLLTEMGATPIDYRTQDFVTVLHELEPEGIDYVFNGMGEEYFERGLTVLRRGGTLVHYGAPQSFGCFLLLLVKFLLYTILPNGKSILGYGTHRIGLDQLKEDWAVLFNLLAEGQIKPKIAATFPLLEAASANDLLEGGGVIGNIVLLPSEPQ
ncbi:MAG: medium chain dehydrogenase/reductase family protein [Anaerolineae bacterium]|nr:medium chain dehydrogenase/reductase family protein [Anaerolineae bacterium]